MCGITGFWDFKNQLSFESRQTVVESMTEAINSRGPDGQGVWIDSEHGLAVGHRRLSIIDLSTNASQPMHSRCGRFVLSYNGEVYNFQELREEMKKAGINFKTHSDTEIVLEACALYGVKEASKKFNGMFAFCLWDRQQKKLYLVRDRLGIKPLYWGIHKGFLFFGSQLKSFRPHPLWQPRLNQKALGLYFQYKYVPTPFSIYEDIFKLDPGHILTVDASQKPKKESFWDLKSIAMNSTSLRKESPSQENILKELEDTLTDSVRKILISDVPIGCFLSGGIDSSLIATLMQSLSDKPIQTFSIGFERSSYNEAPQAKKIASFLGTHHHEEILTEKKCLDIIPDLATFYDEPFSDSSQIPTYLVSALAKKNVTVVLSGDGGDELFAGYNRYKIAYQLWNKLLLLPKSTRSAGASILSSLPFSFLKPLESLLPSTLPSSNLASKISKLSKILRARSEKEFYECLTKQNRGIQQLLNSSIEPLLPLEEVRGLSFIEHMQYWDTQTYLPDDILVKVDRASMAVGIEARVPFLDHRVVELSWQIPMNFKIRKGETKWVLKNLLRQKIPPELILQPKKGFAVPIGEWLKGPLRPWAEEMIYSKSTNVDSSYIQNLWKIHLSNKEDCHEILWSYLMFDQWAKKYT